jgi:glycosyltransferase involved in cell wall biosynthesis
MVAIDMEKYDSFSEAEANSTKKLKILYVTEFFYPERVAGAYRAYYLSKEWAKMGHQVTVLTTFPNFPNGKRFKEYKKYFYKHEILMPNLEVIRIPIVERPNTSVLNRMTMYLSFFVSGFIFGLIRFNYLNKRKYDIVLGTSGPLFTPLLALFLRSILRSKLVIEYRDLGYIQARALEMSKIGLSYLLFKKIEIDPSRKADSVVVLTESFAKSLINDKFHSEKVFVITNGASLESNFVIANSQLLEGIFPKPSFVIGYIGTLGLSQDLLNIVKSIKIIEEKGNIDIPVYLFLLGEGAEKSHIKEIVKELNIKKVILFDSVPKEELNAYYELCDICLVSLKDEENFEGTIPSKIFDILAHKKPILFLGPKGEAATLIEKSGAGFYFNNKDPVSIAEFIEKKLIRVDKQTLSIMGNAGYEFVINHFLWDKIAMRYISVLYSVLREGRNDKKEKG